MAPGEFDQLVMQAGQAHEKVVLQQLGNHVRAISPTHTKELIEAETPVIYQPVFEREDLQLVAQPDFLLLEQGKYRVADAKLARSVRGKKGILAQIGTYQIAAGFDLPAIALLPQGVIEETDNKATDLANTFIDGMKDLLASDHRPPANYVASKCDSCPYCRLCVPTFEREGNLGLNYHIDSRSIPHLNRLGIQAMADLSNASEETLEDGPYFKSDRKLKARDQAKSFLSGGIFRLAEPCLPNGTPIHFDVETWPLRDDGKSDVYLWGFLVPPYCKNSYEYIWSDTSPSEDESSWFALIDKIAEFRNRYESPVLVHYSNYEVTQIREYVRRYQSENNEQVTWLLESDGALFDLRKSVLDSLILPLTRYGLKDICKDTNLVNFQWQLRESGSQWSVIRFHDYLNTEDSGELESIKEELLTYNLDDVRATRELELWLAQFVDD